MLPTTIIAKKRDNGELSPQEITDFINGYVSGDIADYQMAALAMAIYLRGMNATETAALTDAMLNSGVQLTWESPFPAKVDKHSTGGLGDKTSLILAPLLACCGLQVPMLSGRGLGATGGTLDKLEAIPGYRTDLSLEEIRHLTENVGCVITGTTPNLVPADRKLYALRDVTATVPSIPLITASIMSKKLAEGLTALVLDVKFGSGAFMKTLDDARALARSLVATGKRMGVTTVALLTDMNQPLGRMVGNAVEVDESIAAMQGEGSGDLIDVTTALGAELLVATGKAASQGDARAQLQGHIASGAALAKFEEMVTAQGGNLALPRPVASAHEVGSPSQGVVSAIDTEQLGLAVIELRGGRRKMGDQLDLSTGIEMLVRVGDRVEDGQPLARVFAPSALAEEACRRMQAAVRIGDQAAPPLPLIVDRISS
ncbi:MAG: thymidine phosphorylase [Fimbriimonadaceae bacterium]|nr:thymidine phosphorylase [Fimbriimonadaceae bacterium]QYK54687.1 MAG: thymidine phosphorylase [Fimbriimonadaceae bacterium]